MSDFQRVRDKRTGEELSVRRPNLERFDVLDKPAVDRYGRRLRNKPRTSVAKAAESKKQQSPTKGAEPATTPEEGSV